MVPAAVGTGRPRSSPSRLKSTCTHSPSSLAAAEPVLAAADDPAPAAAPNPSLPDPPTAVHCPSSAPTPLPPPMSSFKLLSAELNSWPICAVPAESSAIRLLGSKFSSLANKPPMFEPPAPSLPAAARAPSSTLPPVLPPASSAVALPLLLPSLSHDVWDRMTRSEVQKCRTSRASCTLRSCCWEEGACRPAQEGNGHDQ
eukprot:1138913-Pelagomonas_calceolata.AAC.5